MLGTQTRGSKMEGAHEPTELWRHPKHKVTQTVDKYFSSVELFSRRRRVTEQTRFAANRIDPIAKYV